jgi:hypothetical protein
MKHYLKEEWSDFVNQFGTKEKLNEMQAHLASGCKPCGKTVSLWQKVRQSGMQEANFQPPESAVRTVKSAYRTAGYSRKRSLRAVVAELVFDSFSQPVLVGARSAMPAARQMVYRGGPFEIDVHIETKPGSSRLSVTGQLMHVDEPGTAAKAVAVVLSNRRGNRVRTATNEFGEFQAELENLGDLELRISDAGGAEIVVSLRDALSELPGGTRSG